MRESVTGSSSHCRGPDVPGEGEVETLREIVELLESVDVKQHVV